MDLTADLSAAEGQVLTNFRACIGLPGLTQRELGDLSAQFEDLKEALKTAPSDARRLEIMRSAARVFSDLAKKGPRP
jgi:hypothetical protein